MRLVVLNSVQGAQLAATQKVLKSGDLQAVRSYRSIIESAQQTAEQLVEAAREQGRQHEAQARQQAQRDHERVMAATALEAAAWRQRAAAALEQDLSQLVTEALTLLLHAQPRDALIGQALNAVRTSLSRASWVRVAVHPDHAAAASVALQEFAERAALSCPVSVSANPHLKPEDCVIESNFGSADASVATQLANLAPALAEATQGLARGLSDARESQP